jgi:hypothetical protein
MELKITDNYFEYGNMKYFRENAQNVQIGTFGEKKDPPGARAYIDPQGKVKAEHLASRVERKSSVGFDWSKTTRAAVEVNGIPVKVFGIDSEVAVAAGYEKVKSGKYKLISFGIDELPLKTVLNRDADGARKFLADEGNDGRIVSEVWVVAEVELAESFDTAGSITFAANGDGLKVIASGGKHGTHTVHMTPGATFAYKLHKVKDWSNHKSEIDSLEADWKGNG